MKRNTPHYKIWQILKGYKGDTISLYWLTSRCNREAWWHGEATVRRYVSELVTLHGKPIGSCQDGYYIITNKKELKEHTDALTHTGMMYLKRVAALNKSTLYKVYKQGELQLKEKK